MAAGKFPKLGLGGDGRTTDGTATNGFVRDRAERFGGVLGRRIVAHIIDSLIVYAAAALAVLILAFMNVLTLGLLAAPVIGLGVVVPVLYFAAFTGGPRAATPGMRLLKIELGAHAGGHPGYLQATLRTVLYYATIAVLSPLVLVVALFNDRRRALHDILSGTVVINHLVVANPRRLPEE